MEVEGGVVDLPMDGNTTKGKGVPHDPFQKPARKHENTTHEKENSADNCQFLQNVRARVRESKVETCVDTAPLPPTPRGRMRGNFVKERIPPSL